MNILALSWKNLISKPLNLLLSLILFGLGVGLIALLLLVRHQVEGQFDKNLAGIDLVIGAKGSPLQLILATMYHIDAPTGNVAISKVKPFLNPRHPYIQTAVPLSLGDSHRGYRLVGSNATIYQLYGAQAAQGRLANATMEVTLGATVAAKLQLKLGATFRSAHGLVDDEDLVHADAAPFRVVGILAPTGAVIDQLIITPAQSIWAVHDHGDGGTDVASGQPEESTEHEHPDEAGELRDHADEKGEHHDHDHADEAGEEHHDHHAAISAAQPLTDFPEKSITALLIQFKGRNVTTLNMQRSINENTDLQAATPALEISRLYALLGIGIDALRWLALAIIAVSGLSIFISLYASLQERRYELALLRTMGASPAQVFAMIILEGLLLAALGLGLGLALSHGGMTILAQALAAEYRYSFSGLIWISQEWLLVAGALAVGLLAAVIPAIQASNTDISATLAQD